MLFRSGEAVDGVHARVDRDLLLKDAHLIGTVDDGTGQRAFSGKTHEDQRACLFPQVVAQMVQNAAARQIFTFIEASHQSKMLNGLPVSMEAVLEKGKMDAERVLKTLNE